MKLLGACICTNLPLSHTDIDERVFGGWVGGGRSCVLEICRTSFCVKCWSRLFTLIFTPNTNTILFFSKVERIFLGWTVVVECVHCSSTCYHSIPKISTLQLGSPLSQLVYFLIPLVKEACVNPDFEF